MKKLDVSSSKIPIFSFISTLSLFHVKFLSLSNSQINLICDNIRNIVIEQAILKTQHRLIDHKKNI